MTAILANAINAAACDLPGGWLIELCVERGAGWVELYNPDGDRHEFEDSTDLTLGEQVTAAIREAIRAAGKPSAQETCECVTADERNNCANCNPSAKALVECGECDTKEHCKQPYGICVRATANR